MPVKLEMSDSWSSFLSSELPESSSIGFDLSPKKWSTPKMNIMIELFKPYF
jgi:hypothetical protein